MALVVKDRIKVTAAAPGTGNVTLGSAELGYQTFAAIGNNNSTYYAIQDLANNLWEVGEGVFTTSGPTLTRSQVLSNSAGNTSAINFTNAVEVFVTTPATKSVHMNLTDDLEIDGDVTFTSDNATDQVLIKNTNTGASAAPDLVLWRDSASPANADSVGRIDFRGEDDGSTARNYTSIESKIVNVAASTPTGAIHFKTLNASTSEADVLVLSGNAATFAGGVDAATFFRAPNFYTGVGSQGLVNTNTNDLKLVSQSGDTHIYMDNDLAVELYHNNAKKLETTSSGIDVTGGIVADHHVNIGTGMSYQWGDSHERIEQSDGVIEFFTGNNEKMRLQGSTLLVGSTTAIDTTLSGGTPALQVVGSGFSAIQSTTRRDSGAYGPAVILAKSKNATVGSYTAVVDNDSLGSIIFIGDDGTDLDTYGATIGAEVNGTPGSNDMPADLVFSTNGGTSTVTERVRILSTGGVGIGQTSPVSSIEYALHVEGSSVSSGGGLAVICATDTSTAYNGTNPGGGITFRGKYNNSGSITNFGSVQAVKENTADGNYASALRFTTRVNGGNLTEQLRIASSGNATFAGSVTANNIIASGAASSFNSGATNTVATFTSTDSVAGIQLVDNAGAAEITAEGNTFQVRPAGGAAKLSVSASGATFADTVSAPSFDFTSTGGPIYFGSGTDDYLYLLDVGTSGNSLAFVQDSSTKFSIQGTSGNATFAGTVTASGFSGKIHPVNGTTTNYLSLKDTNELNFFNAGGTSQTLHINYDGGNVGLGGNAVTVSHNGNTVFGSAIGATYMYDASNSGYYVDPASTSKLGETRIITIQAGDTVANQLSSRGQISIYASSNPYMSFHNGGTARSGYLQHIVGGDRFYFGEVSYTESVGSFRAPLFYDTDNTGYYLDPASTSNLNNVNIWNNKFAYLRNWSGSYGSAGQVLTSGGSGAAADWADAGGGAWSLVSKSTISNANTVNYTVSAGVWYRFMIYGLTMATSQLRLALQLSSDGGSNMAYWCHTSNEIYNYSASTSNVINEHAYIDHMKLTEQVLRLSNTGNGVNYNGTVLEVNYYQPTSGTGEECRVWGYAHGWGTQRRREFFRCHVINTQDNINYLRFVNENKTTASAWNLYGQWNLYKMEP